MAFGPASSGQALHYAHGWWSSALRVLGVLRACWRIAIGWCWACAVRWRSATPWFWSVLWVFINT
eukprot:4896393-Alexandrium_andersonii.AAC.1